MLLKSADDKTKRLALLDDLQRSHVLDRRQRDWLRDESHRTRRGLAGERDAAHYLDSYLKDDPDRALLHDLRFKVDGEVIQIDHMVITRGLYVYLLETKNFNGSLRINEFGEFSVEYPGERVFGIPSPLEQSRRHAGPLRKLFDTLDIQGRSGGGVHIQHCVLIHPSGIIRRPAAAKFDTSNVIKADQFSGWHQRFQDEAFGVGAFVNSLLNMRGADTIKEFAQKLVRQHRPADPLALPEFMKPRDVPVAAAASPSPRSEPVESCAPHRRTSSGSSHPPGGERRKLVCATCGSKISFAEGKYCWNNERRFGGVQYCRAHQAAV